MFDGIATPIAGGLHRLESVKDEEDIPVVTQRRIGPVKPGDIMDPANQAQ